MAEKSSFKGGEIHDDGTLERKDGLRLHPDGTIDSKVPEDREVILADEMIDVRDDPSKADSRKAPKTILGRARVKHGAAPGFELPRGISVDGVAYSKWSDDFYVRASEAKKVE